MHAAAANPARRARSLAVAALAALLVFTGACATPPPESSYTKRIPGVDPVTTRTTFSGALSCMDDLLQSYGRRGTLITSSGIPDATGQVQAGSRDMLMSAISEMTRRSGALTYVDLDVTREEALAIHGNRPDKQSLWPEFLIRGTITGLDENVVDWSKGASVGFASGDYDATAAYAKNSTSSVVSLDLFVVRARDLVLLPGLKASNSLAVSRSGSAKDGGLTIKQVGMDFSMELEESESLHHAIRTLVELGAVELIGKFAKVPYWRCLQVDGTNPIVIKEAADWYDEMDEDERLLFVQRVLIARGELAGPASGSLDGATRAAIARYQQVDGQLPTGRINFELYYSLLGDDRQAELGEPVTFVAPEATPDPVVDEIPVPDPLLLTLTTGRGNEPAYAPLEMLDLRVGVSRDAYVYCYYEDGEGRVSRIFPNQGTPDPHLAGGQYVAIPPRNAAGDLTHFGIQLQHPGAREEVSCLASDREVGMWLPDPLKQADLQPLPVRSLDEVEAAFDEVDAPGLVRARLPIAVTQAP